MDCGDCESFPELRQMSFSRQIDFSTLLEFLYLVISENKPIRKTNTWRQTTAAGTL